MGSHNSLLVEELEKSCAQIHGNSHNNTFTDAINWVLHRLAARPRNFCSGKTYLSTMQGCIKQIISGFFKRCKHQMALLHLGDTEASDAKHLALPKRVRVVTAVSVLP